MIFLYVYLDCCTILLKSTKNAPVSPKANWPDLLPAMARDAGLEEMGQPLQRADSAPIRCMCRRGTIFLLSSKVLPVGLGIKST